MSNIVADAARYVEAGVIPVVPDLSNVHTSQYADFAVSYLGEYRPPQ